MRILFITNNSYMFYRFRRELIKQLCTNNEVFISMPAEENTDDFVRMGCRVIDTPVDRRGHNPLRDLKLYKEYKQILKQVCPDRVVTYSIKPNIYAGYACRKLGIPYCVNVQGLGTAFEGGLQTTLIIRMYRIAMKKAKVVFFENEGNRQVFLKDRIVSENMTHVLNGAGVNLNEYSLTPYPQKDEACRFLFIGRIMREKGLDELFSAINRIKIEYPRTVFRFLGWYEDNYENQMKEFESRGLIEYGGFIQDVRDDIAACHCVILPSWHEGMSNTLLEGAAMGRPLITTNIHGCKEAVEDGKSGFLCEVKNANSLYESIRDFLELPYEQKKQMGIAGRERMRMMFDKDSVVHETIKRIIC